MHAAEGRVARIFRAIIFIVAGVIWILAGSVPVFISGAFVHRTDVSIRALPGRIQAKSSEWAAEV